jgi:excisionase family DNA binding protein
MRYRAAMPALKHTTTPIWIPVPEAARLLGVSPRSIRAWVAEGKLRARTDLGRSMLVAYVDVVGPLSAQSTCTRETPGHETVAAA